MIDRQAQRQARKAIEVMKEVQEVCDDVPGVRGVKMGLQDDETFWLGIGLLLAGEYRLVELHREPTEEYPKGYIRLRYTKLGGK